MIRDARDKFLQKFESDKNKPLVARDVAELSNNLKKNRGYIKF